MALLQSTILSTAFTLTTTLYQTKLSRKQFYKVWFKVTQFLTKLSKMMWPTFCYSTLFQIHILKKMSYVECGLWTIFAKSCNCLAAKKSEAIGNLDPQFVNLPLLFNLWTSIINIFCPPLKYRNVLGLPMNETEVEAVMRWLMLKTRMLRKHGKSNLMC